MVEDFFALLLIFPLSAFQMDQHMMDNDPDGLRKKNDDYAMNGLSTGNKPESPVEYMPGEATNKAYIVNEMPRESIHL